MLDLVQSIDWLDHYSLEEIGKLPSQRAVERAVGVGRGSDFEGVGSLIAREDMAGKTCTTLRIRVELGSHNFLA